MTPDYHGKHRTLWTTANHIGPHRITTDHSGPQRPQRATVDHTGPHQTTRDKHFLTTPTLHAACPPAEINPANYSARLSCDTGRLSSQCKNVHHYQPSNDPEFVSCRGPFSHNSASKRRGKVEPRLFTGNESAKRDWLQMISSHFDTCGRGINADTTGRVGTDAVD